MVITIPIARRVPMTAIKMTKILLLLSDGLMYLTVMVRGKELVLMIPTAIDL